MKQVEIGEREGKKFRFFEQGGRQQQNSKDGEMWPKKKWATLGLTLWLFLPTQSWLVTGVSTVGKILGHSLDTSRIRVFS